MKQIEVLISELKDEIKDLDINIDRKKGLVKKLETLDTKFDNLELMLSNKEATKRLMLPKKNKFEKAKVFMEYEEDLKNLQEELIKLHNWVVENNKRIVIIFEGRDTAGKGGAIKRFTEHLNPRRFRVVALPKPSDVEKGQFYFQRYFKKLPNPGEIVFFDRSWYNRAVVEPVMGFCSDLQYDRFMKEVPEFEHALGEDGIIIIKFWFSISKEEQEKRFEARKVDPLKQWKLSPVDAQAQGMWNRYTKYKELMFSRTHTSYSPWVIVKGDDKKKARLESIRYVLSSINYEGKSDKKTSLLPDPDIVQRYHREISQVDN